MERYRRILVLGRSHIGDCLLTTPALRALRGRFPDSRIDIAIPRSNRDLLEGNSRLDEMVFRPDLGDWAAKPRFALTMRRRRYDLLVSFQEKSLFYGWLAAFTGARRRIGLYHPRTRFYFTDHVPVPEGVHETEKYLAVTRALGCDSPGSDLELAVMNRARYGLNAKLSEAGVPTDERFVGINPGATTADKRWSTAAFAATAGRLSRELGHRVLVLGGPGDLPLADELRLHLRRPPIVLTGRTSLGETAAALERCRILLTNDTGPMHMADALSVPLVAVFGPTNPIKFGPRSTHSVIVRESRPCPRCLTPCMHSVTPDRVVQAAAGLAPVSKVAMHRIAVPV